MREATARPAQNQGRRRPILPQAAASGAALARTKCLPLSALGVRHGPVDDFVLPPFLLVKPPVVRRRFRL